MANFESSDWAKGMREELMEILHKADLHNDAGIQSLAVALCRMSALCRVHRLTASILPMGSQIEQWARGENLPDTEARILFSGIIYAVARNELAKHVKCATAYSIYEHTRN